jgi:dihydroorotase
VAVATDLALAEQTGARVHFRGLSTASGTRLFGRARYDNPSVTADVSAHQLHLTEEDVAGFDGNCHVIPPLRTRGDRDALRRAVSEGIIGAICSDHQPHEPDAKNNPFPATEPGMSGLETLLPLVLRLVDEGLMALGAALERVTWGPARILGVPYGRLDPGRSADVCVFDPGASWRLLGATMLSRGHNTCFAGQELRGQVRWTLLGGRVVFAREASEPSEG